MYKILFADDDREIAETVKNYFSAAGFDIAVVYDGRAAVDMTELYVYDFIILDVMMPLLDGISACREIRKKHRTPVLFMSALGEEKDLLKGYSVGADDYIIKPFPLSVLVEKCLAVIRRYTGSDSKDIIKIGEVKLDCFKRKVYVGENEISLSAKDYEILQYLMSKKGVVLSRSLILSRVWGYDFEGEERVVDSHIKNIRKALGEYGGYIKTSSGIGYVFEEEMK